MVTIRLQSGPAEKTLRPGLIAWAVAAFVALLLVGPAGSRGGDGPLADAGESARSAAEASATLVEVQSAFERVIASVSPSVVGIRAHRRYITGPERDEKTGGTRLFEQLVTINGSGTIIDSDGLILTNEHVVQSAEDIEVLFHDGRGATAKVLAADARSDLAVIQVAAKNLVPAKFCDWQGVSRGQWAIALGNPFGLGNDGKLSASVGVISNLGRRLPGLGEADDRLYHDMIQTTAAINPGNSGGPLFNARGEVIGVVAAMHTRAAGDEGVGFAIPMSPARRRTIATLQAGRKVEYGYIGLTVRPAEPQERRQAGLEDPLGALVLEVEPDGPAARAGVRQDDLIVALAGKPLSDCGEFIEGVGASVPGQTLTLRVRRGGEEFMAKLSVERRQVSRVAWMRGGAVLWRGMRLADPPLQSQQADASGIVVIDVAKDSPAARAQVRVGDVIERVGDEPATNVEGFRQVVLGRNGALSVQLRDRGVVVIQP